MQLGLVGLGKMGSQIGEVLLGNGHQLVVDTRHQLNTEPLVRLGADSFTNYNELAAKLADKPIVWLMIPHEHVPAEITKLVEVLPPGSLIIDGGNSNYKSTIEQANRLRDKDINLVDVGVSGGVRGKEQGFSLMVGGDTASVKTITPLLDALAGKQGGWHYFGGSGAGHFVKMVHNGVEYGLMQSFAEGYQILKFSPFNLDLAEIASVWQKGSINQSFLNGLILDMLKNDSEFTAVEGRVSESGEARWTLEAAAEANLPAPAIKAALDIRLKSQTGQTSWATKFLAQLRNEFGGHNVNPKQD
ncbi:MAG TPA: decarboxylating 6-phosphogluconate dehydrogenase [Candidatus Saccharimonadales bacterium]